jgi:hypothetical protein
MKHLPANTPPEELRLSARYLAKVSAVLFSQKGNAITLLDRAAKLSPEDDESRQLREKLK